MVKKETYIKYLSTKAEGKEQLVKLQARLKDIKSWLTESALLPYLESTVIILSGLVLMGV